MSSNTRSSESHTLVIEMTGRLRSCRIGEPWPLYCSLYDADAMARPISASMPACTAGRSAAICVSHVDAVTPSSVLTSAVVSQAMIALVSVSERRQGSRADGWRCRHAAG